MKMMSRQKHIWNFTLFILQTFGIPQGDFMHHCRSPGSGISAGPQAFCRGSANDFGTCQASSIREPQQEGDQGVQGDQWMNRRGGIEGMSVDVRQHKAATIKFIKKTTSKFQQYFLCLELPGLIFCLVGLVSIPEARHSFGHTFGRNVINNEKPGLKL